YVELRREVTRRELDRRLPLHDPLDVDPEDQVTGRGHVERCDDPRAVRPVRGIPDGLVAGTDVGELLARTDDGARKARLEGALKRLDRLMGVEVGREFLE